jgi:hypothetical protein
MRRWLASIGGILGACSFTTNPAQPPDDATGRGGEPLPVADGRPNGSDADPPPPDAPIDARPDAPIDAMMPPLPCPAGYTLTDANHPGSQYRLVTASAIWSTAEATCEADEVGGVTAPAHLIVMDDAAEAQFAWDQNTSDQWVGHSDQITENAWLPVTDQPNVFTGGANGNNNGRDCLMISNTNSETTAETCMNGHPYVCECDGRRANPGHF